MLTRRHFIATSTALFSAPIASYAQTETETAAAEAERVVKPPVSPPEKWPVWDARVTPADYVAETTNPWGLHPRFLPVRVAANPGLKPGDVHVDAVARYLYFIEADGSTALRYGVAIAKGTLYEPGTYKIRVKKKWPTWRPTDSMIEREPEKFEQYKDGMDGGPTNPLGARALYLFDGNRDTFLRIHGTPHPRSIGGRASSGCVRMAMPHIIDLYPQVPIGATAFLYAPETPLT